MSDTTVTDDAKNPLLSDKLYKTLEWVARILLPAIAVLYAALSALWHWPNTVEVVGTITAIDVFLGAFIGLAQRSYDNSDAPYNGTVVATPTPNGAVLSNLVLDKDPGDLTKLVLKVQKDA